MVITSDSHEGVKTYYTLDGSEPTEASAEYTAPFSLSNNATVKARSFKEGYNPSDVVEFAYVHSDYVVLPPTITVDGTTVTLTSQTEGSALYYAIGDSDPTKFTEYTAPFTMDGNGTIYAQARKTGMYDSEVAVYTVSDKKASNPEITYDGRYVTISCDDDDAEIYYSLGSGNPADGEQYTGTFDAMNVGVVKAIAKKEGYHDSDVAEYTVTVYTDEEHAETSVAGVLHSGFGWYENLPQEVESYRFEGPLGDEDLGFIHNMKSLRHLDMAGAEVTFFPDSIFAKTNLVSVDMPMEMEGYGEGIFAESPLLSAIIWRSMVDVEERLTAGIYNPNLLLYLFSDDEILAPLGYRPPLCPQGRRLRREGTIAANIVEDDYTDSLTLTDGYPFYAPYEFTADVATYEREFSKVTEINGCSGWETLTLPFDVQTVSDSRGEATPFAAEDGSRRFWLFHAAGTGWERTDAIKAYKPYLIAMPNHPWYDDRYIITGTVTFRAENALIEATPEPVGVSYKNGFEMVANYMPKEAADDVYVINDEAIEGHIPGSVFAASLRDVRPFEGYLTGISAARYLPVFDNSEVEMLMGATSMKIWSEGNVVCILSPLDAKVRIYDTVGRLVRIADARAGEVCRVNDLNKGIYIVGSVKLSL